ncbi:permease prefix domain 1-containing protein [Bacillus sp. JJ722]|uniref:permease prefix domain 1-containing protein n=1 Tax=Bacillus sp. JJ722 TaxID=3122973 RepID=UPI00300002FB
MKNLSKYVQQILDQTDCTKEEKEDLAEELLIHLEILTQEHIDNGLSEEEAIQQAMMSFGLEQDIGSQLQQALFPYRRYLLIALGLGFIVLNYSIFTVLLLEMQEAESYTLIFNILIGLCFLFITAFPTFSLRRKILINSTIVLFLMGSTINILNLLYSNLFISNILLFLSVLLALVAIALLYITTLHRTSSDHIQHSSRKHIHIINITTGIIIAICSIFFGFGFLIMVGVVKQAIFILAIPICTWALLYWIQFHYYFRLKKTTYVFTSISVIAASLIVVGILYMLVQSLIS